LRQVKFAYFLFFQPLLSDESRQRMFDPIWSRRLARSGAQARGHRSGNDGPQTVRVYSFLALPSFVSTVLLPLISSILTVVVLLSL
jgi:hypothetical protein